MRRVAAVLCTVLLFATACQRREEPAPSATGTPSSGEVTGPQTYTIGMDGPSPEGRQFQYTAYYPRSLRARPGDTVVFENRSTQSIHTVSLGVAEDRSNQPLPITPAGATNPAVFAPCFLDADPTPALTACEPAPDAGAAPPPFDGTGFWNSGQVLFDVPGAPTPPPAETRRVILELAESIRPGSYPVVCLIHPFMDATIEVVGADEDRLTPVAVEQAGQQALATDVEAAADLPVPTGSTGEEGATVVAGTGDRVTAVNAFFPAAVTVDAGDTVTWKTQSPFEPHTVTFENRFASPDDPGVPAAAGPAPGGAYTGGFAHSGIFGPPPVFPTDTYALRFTEPGSYAYLCVLHPGMGGTVTVR